MPKIMNTVVPPPRRAGVSGLADKAAMTFGERSIGFVARRRCHQFEVVPRPLALRRLLHLEQIGRREITPILANGRFAEAVVLNWHLLHLRHRRRPALLRLGGSHFS